MATYFFDTITAAEALAFTPQDTLVFRAVGATALATTVTYSVSGATVSITNGAITKIFPTANYDAGVFIFLDGSGLLVGGNGADIAAITTSGSYAMFGGQGDDVLAGGVGADLIQGNLGADNLSGGAGADTIYGGQGNDTLSGGLGLNFLQGNIGDDLMSALSSSTLLGGQGADTLVGSASNDYLSGDLGNDSILSGGGFDLIFGLAGDDTILVSGGGTVSGGEGNDVITGDGDSRGAILQGNAGTDLIISSGIGNSLLGGQGDDILLAVNGTDSYLSGDAGNDNLTGGEGRDTLLGGIGNDTLEGGRGADVLSGFSGNNLFVFNSPTPDPVAEIDQITDWTPTGRLHFGPIGAAAATAATYREVGSAADFTAGLNAANALMATTAVKFAVYQISGAAVVYADYTGDGVVDQAVALVGRALSDIDVGQII